MGTLSMVLRKYLEIRFFHTTLGRIPTKKRICWRWNPQWGRVVAVLLFWHFWTDTLHLHWNYHLTVHTRFAEYSRFERSRNTRSGWCLSNDRSQPRAEDGKTHGKLIGVQVALGMVPLNCSRPDGKHTNFPSIQISAPPHSTVVHNCPSVL